MLGLWAWIDDLNVILFEFLDDDTKLAQSCRIWLYVPQAFDACFFIVWWKNGMIVKSSSRSRKKIGISYVAEVFANLGTWEDDKTNSDS